jgi:hypothetical protein
MLNIKGENNMSKNEVKQASLRSELWSLVHEVSKLDLDLAKKLDVVISDLQEVQFRIGMDKGTEIGLEVSEKGRALLSHMRKENS